MDELKYGERAIAEARLECWPNPFEQRNYTVDVTFPEFTCLCPRSGYPDFATLCIKYIPDKYVVELKSLKLFLNKYRNLYISHEDAINRIYSELYGVLKPRFLEVVGDFNPRGNVKTIVRVSSEEDK
ncbi:MAG: NADPH-dependent 7-cyano-7-deazaguanine reductase QueF [Deltaproteobacteria bacterium]|nr:NADPH-dependent 7-cyano-7-deazaguanine reductase QueF [Deltaproteobacteria bacterium]